MVFFTASRSALAARRWQVLLRLVADPVSSEIFWDVGMILDFYAVEL
jgi:hypothetical protein